VPGAATPLPTLSASPSALNFGAVMSSGSLTAVTSAQIVRLTQTGAGSVTWVAVADQPWIQIAGGSGSGNGSFTIGISATGLPSTGTATATVTVSASGAQASPAITVRVTVMTPTTATGPFGSIDTPQDGVTGVSGAIAVTGWALDDVEVSRVQIFRDAIAGEPAGPIFIGDAVLVAGARPDIEAAYPPLPYNDRAGWGYMLLTNMLPAQGNGTFTLHAVATDADGHQTLLGTRSFTANNAAATKPFGAIDTPGLSAVASGNAYANIGWVLTPQPKSIAFDGSTIAVYVDGVMVGRPGPLAARPDIQGLFPGYLNTDHSTGIFVLDTTAYANGIHTIAWVVTDSDGVSEGIGSRYFRIDNSGAPLVAMATASPIAASALAADSGHAIRARVGFDGTAPFELVRSVDGRRRVTAYELDRIELRLGEDRGQHGVRFDGHLSVGGERRPLPVGSTLDPSNGRFSWDPGPGFIGRYEFVFSRTGPDDRGEQIAVQVVLRPRHRNGSRIASAIDSPIAGEVAATFVISGWAADRGAAEGSGVDAIAIWGYPSPGTGAPPIFLGMASLAEPRPEGSPFTLGVSDLAPGEYALLVAPRSTVTRRFEAGTMVRVTVR
jgi:hypothetical protein